MKCVQCHYLLWDLPENRCPECALPFDVADYAFTPRSVQFLCPHCEYAYWGADSNGLPYPHKFECVQCCQSIEASQMRVRPMAEDAHGESICAGTAWDDRGRVGLVKAFADGVARLAMQPAEYFRLSYKTRQPGAIFFSVLCAYIAALVFIGTLTGLQWLGLIRWGPHAALILKPWMLAMIVCAVPCLQIGWDYFYGFFIYAILGTLGLRSRDLEQSVRAVALSSAVLPALLLLPPIGVPWYLKVVSSGIEHYNQTTRSRAVLATIIPALVMGNIVVALAFTFLTT